MGQVGMGSELRVALRKEFLMLRVVGHWNRLPKEVGNAPSLPGFQVTQWKVSLWEVDELEGVFQAKAFQASQHDPAAQHELPALPSAKSQG